MLSKIEREKKRIIKFLLIFFSGVRVMIRSKRRDKKEREMGGKATDPLKVPSKRERLDFSVILCS